MSANPPGGFATLPHTVIRLKAGDISNDSIVHVGTGFFFWMELSDTTVPLIISNKHVVCDRAWIEFDFGSVNTAGERVFGPANTLRVHKNELIIYEHPDPSVDLAAIRLIPLLERMRSNGVETSILALSEKNFAPSHIQRELHASASVIMVGFPDGIMDEVNNLPVVRRGILATHYRADYLGKTDFLADIAAFGGSSGSPVFAVFDHTLPDENGNLTLLTSPRTFFIGVLHSGPTTTAQGIVPAPVPTTHLISHTKVMIHLGICVKASRIEEMRPIIEAAGGIAG